MQSCRCSATTALLLRYWRNGQFTADGLQAATYGTALACSAQHQATLLDPLHGTTCASSPGTATSARRLLKA